MAAEVILSQDWLAYLNIYLCMFSVCSVEGGYIYISLYNSVMYNDNNKTLNIQAGGYTEKQRDTICGKQQVVALLLVYC